MATFLITAAVIMLTLGLVSYFSAKRPNYPPHDGHMLSLLPGDIKYESPSGNDQAFGFYKGGVTLSVPLGFVPEEYGSWNVAAGPAVYAFNSNLKNFNKGNNPWVVGTVSLNFTY
jgi:hypothetical protein